MDFSNLGNMDFSNLPNMMPAPQAQAPTAAPIYTPPPQMGGNARHVEDFSNLGNFNLR
jgi:hypothetical protein